MNQDVTFRTRVQEFWQWFPGVAGQLAETIKSGDQEKTMAFLGASFTNDVREKIGGLSWVFGVGEGNGRLSFTVTGEGQVSRQLLSHFWLTQAVEVPGWDFYCFRQPSPVEQLAGSGIEVGDNKRVDFDTLMVATEVDEENENVNITAWHEVFDELEDVDRFQILYLLLDEALGEYGTQTKLGSIEFRPDPNASPLAELPGFLAQTWSEKGWQERSPLETYSGYQADPGEDFDRADTIAGYTIVPNVVIEFLNQRGQLDEDPIEGTGAELIFVRVDRGHLDDEDPLEFRTSIEDEISKRLNGGGGYVIGGATGVHNSYIDIVIFDGHRSRAAIDEALEELQLDGKYEIRPFAVS